MEDRRPASLRLFAPTLLGILASIGLMACSGGHSDSDARASRPNSDSVSDTESRTETEAGERDAGPTDRSGAAAGDTRGKTSGSDGDAGIDPRLRGGGTVAIEGWRLFDGTGSPARPNERLVIEEVVIR